MAVSMYQLSVPIFIKFLDNLTAILDKAASHAAARKIEPAALLATRLYPNMFTLAQQVEVATDHAAYASAAIAGIDRPTLPEGGISFESLKHRIAATVDFLKSLKPEQMAESEDKDITITMSANSRPRDFTGLELLSYFTLPNFYFHIATAYGILRHCGVEIGKRDYTGRQ